MFMLKLIYLNTDLMSFNKDRKTDQQIRKYGKLIRHHDHKRTLYCLIPMFISYLGPINFKYKKIQNIIHEDLK